MSRIIPDFTHLIEYMEKEQIEGYENHTVSVIVPSSSFQLVKKFLTSIYYTFSVVAHGQILIVTFDLTMDADECYKTLEEDVKRWVKIR